MDREMSATERAMLEMLRMGCDRTIVSGLLEIQGDYRVPHLRYLEGPVVITKEGMSWADVLPDWLPRAIYCDRFEQIVAENHDERVSKLGVLSEVTALLMCHSFIVPMGHEWSNVYLWATKETYAKHRNGEMPFEISDLTDYERTGYLNDLLFDIRRKVVNAAPKHPHSKLAAQIPKIQKAQFEMVL